MERRLGPIADSGESKETPSRHQLQPLALFTWCESLFLLSLKMWKSRHSRRKGKKNPTKTTILINHQPGPWPKTNTCMLYSICQIMKGNSRCVVTRKLNWENSQFYRPETDTVWWLGNPPCQKLGILAASVVFWLLLDFWSGGKNMAKEARNHRLQSQSQGPRAEQGTPKDWQW